jgi:hypothetical protein
MKGIGRATASQACWMILLVMNICRNKTMFTLKQKLRWQERPEQSCTYPMDLLETVYLWTERLYFISSLIHELEIHPLRVNHSRCMPCPCVLNRLRVFTCLLPVCTTMSETFTTKLIAQFPVILGIGVFISSMIWNVRRCLILSSSTYVWCFEFAKFGTLWNSDVVAEQTFNNASHRKISFAVRHTQAWCVWLDSNFPAYKPALTVTVQSGDPNHGESMVTELTQAPSFSGISEFTCM